MEVLKDNTILNHVDSYKIFSSIGIGTCFSIRSLNLDENRVFLSILKEGQLKNLIPYLLY